MGVGGAGAPTQDFRTLGCVWRVHETYLDSFELWIVANVCRLIVTLSLAALPRLSLVVELVLHVELVRLGHF